MGFKNYLNVYEFECELPGTRQKIKYKPITTNQIKKLLVYENEKNPIVIEQAFDELIKSCIITEDFDYDNIFNQDREFLLIELRKVSKGEQYEYQFNCPKCGSGNLSYIDFNSFPLTSKENDVLEVIEITKDVSIEIGYIRRKEQKESFELIPKNTPKERLYSTMALHSLAASIKSITTPDGKEDNLIMSDRLQIMDSLTFNVMDKIKNFFVDNPFGYDLSYETKCVHCDYTSGKQELDINSNFF